MMASVQPTNSKNEFEFGREHIKIERVSQVSFQLLKKSGSPCFPHFNELHEDLQFMTSWNTFCDTFIAHLDIVGSHTNGCM